MDSQQHASQPEAVDHHDQPHSLPQPQFQQQQQQQHPQPIMMPQQPQQLPQQQGDNAAPPHVSPKGTWFTKMVFRSLSIIFDLIIIGVTAYISTHFDVWAIVIIGPPVSNNLPPSPPCARTKAEKEREKYRRKLTHSRLSFPSSGTSQRL